MLKDSLILLDEISSYLKRLPPVPLTLQLAKKVDSFTSDPFRKTAIRLAKETAAENELRSQTRVAATFTPAGLPVIKAEVIGDILRLSLPESFQTLSDHASIQEKRLVFIAIQQLEGGVELRLVQKEFDS